MSNHLAVATATAAFSRKLLSAAQVAVQNARLRVGPPDATTAANGDPVLNVFLYRMTPAAAIEDRPLLSRTATENAVNDLLSQLHVVGGSTSNIAIDAAFLAADQAKPVGMRDVLPAARLDYDKACRSMTDPELRGWPR